MEALLGLLFVFFVIWLVGRLARAQQPRSFRFSEIEPDPHWNHVRTVKTKIKGVTYRGAQKIIRAKCRAGDALALVREPDNPVDLNAVQIRRILCDHDGEKHVTAEQLGYVSRELAEELAPMLDQGSYAFAKITTLTGSLEPNRRRNVGVNIEIEVYSPVSAPFPASPARSPSTD